MVHFLLPGHLDGSTDLQDSLSGDEKFLSGLVPDVFAAPAATGTGLLPFMQNQHGVAVVYNRELGSAFMHSPHCSEHMHIAYSPTEEVFSTHDEGVYRHFH